ncbi:hypothetical protein C7377_0089 [Balneicella halophila]|uniref:Lipoprotein n=1 Tax=Balneicella halophila TaxID=1537566 RepID=A0A7L4UPY6_BALHA|nr:hypothetical protein [Balneicella halophila]PVX51803.1 hypothetical protein C7377_0089 [Balneicella halophila]
MKKKLKAIAICLVVGLGLSSCALFGERKPCPAYTQISQKTVESEVG